MNEKISFVCIRQRQQQILAPTKKADLRRKFSQKNLLLACESTIMFLSLFDYFLVLCFAGELFTAAEERVFSNKTSVREY